MVALAPTLDLTPASFQALVDRLPPSQRAKVAWFLPELRATFVDPLRAVTDEAQLQGQLVEHLLSFARLNSKLAGALLPLLHEAALRDIVITIDEDRVAGTHRKIEARLGAVDAYAADALREAYAWMLAIFPGLLQHLAALEHDAVVETLMATDGATAETELRQALHGDARALLQLVAFTIAAIEAVDDSARDLPPLIRTWCELALDGVHEAVPVLRRAGLVIPTPTIPGFSQRDWRNRWADHVLEGMPPEQLESFEKDIERSSSTRAV